MTKKLQEYNHHKQVSVALALADVVDKDKNALLQLKSAIIEDPLGLTSNWNPKDTDFCSWYGVTCDPVSRRVTALNLSSDLNHTCSLLSLSATGGNFSLPFSCRRERVANNSSSKLKGQLSPAIGGLAQLRVLLLGFNGFFGELPLEIGRLSLLEILDLGFNAFYGPIPLTLQNFLDLSQNFLSGVVPPELGNCKQLKVLVLKNSYDPLFSRDNDSLPIQPVVEGEKDFNFFDGLLPERQIPASFGKCKNLYFLDLSSNNLTGNLFTGPLPPLLIHSDDFPSKPFYGFWFGGNNLKGNISTYSFDLCRSLDGLIFDIGKNKIIGELPLDMGSHCRCMKFLSLAGNEFVGQVPKTFANLDSLVNLNLSRNQLQGVIPSYIGKLKNLKYFSLSSNNFTGAIPQELVQLTSLEVLELSWNSFSGEIPPDLIKLENLNILRLDHNNFTGKIPTGFSTTASLSLFDVSFNNLSGPVPQNSNLIKCENVQGNPNLQPCHDDPSSSEWEQQHSGGISQQDANSPTGKHAEKQQCVKSYRNCLHHISHNHLFCACSLGAPPCMATAGFNVQNCIGSGGFGATYKAEISPGVVVAVKRLSVGRFQGDQQFDAEIKTLGRVQHPNLVTLIGYHGRPSEFFTAGLWDSGPHDDLIEMLHLAITCTAESRSTRPL
ncbi:hypothetical protein Patl1_00746 [Pistacia atlantica]|uniref:Uncharacterized protein n=1 Tax=Pistacia atlantica TaxID=434234 RepID=A0ACC1C9K0_9ROSI|nr:hypothetical protein Patl1_00746 [Pistacia atlantica]